MIFNMVGGGGAGGASIFIVNSVNQRPANVFNNTLWVNTDVDVVKYVFSDNEPSNPTEGMLWLTISNSDNVNVAAPINKDWMKFNLGIVRQYIDGVWERKLAQLYKDGIWVDVSKLFAAYIDITYPANSTCKVTNSSGQIVASDTNSTSSEKTFTAIVGATGTYTVTATATDGTNTKSQSVEITTEGQLESVELSYQFVLFDGGQIVPMSSGFVYTGCSVSFAGGLITVTSTEFGSVSAVTDNKLSLDRYNTLFVEIVSTNTSGSNGNNSSVFVGGSRDLDPENSGDFRAWKDVSGKTGVQGLDISKLTGNHYVGIGISRAGKFVVSKIWLE